MAMVVAHNLAAQATLSQLNSNNSALKKALKKVSTGEKITGAGDNASDYGISEKMRAQIRALDQDVQNVQNGITMIKIAHGGIQEIVNDLRTMKELAINAANDSNTDADRAIIQKEFEQRRSAINDIATWTNYNTKPLLDGSYENILRRISVDSVNDSPFARAFARAFSPGSPNCFQTDYVQSGYGIVGQIAFEGDGSSWTKSPLSGTDSENEEDDDPTTNIAVKMDFSKASKMGSGFAILCGGCDQYINIKFDSSKNTNSSSRSREITGENTPLTYTVGIAGVKNNAGLAKAIFDAVKYVNNGEEDDEENSGTNSTEIVTLDLPHSVNLLKVKGEYYITKTYSPELILSYGVVGEKQENIESIHRPLTIHHGAHADQRTNFFIGDMHAEALGIDLADVKTRFKATEAIDIIDDAIEYSLDQATDMGSYLQRLEYTESNVTAEDTNVQSAESTIRDADMAKEMTEYTKNNVLSQAAQSMLAQANQNLSSVLSLLQ